MTAAQTGPGSMAVSERSFCCDRTLDTQMRLVTLYLLICGGMYLAGHLVGAARADTGFWDMLHQVPFGAVYGWFCVFLDLAMVVGGFVLLCRPSQRLAVSITLCVLSMLAVGLKFLELYEASTQWRLGSRWGIAANALSPVSQGAATLYVAWFMWRTTYVPGRVAQVVGGALAIDGAFGAMAGVLFFPEVLHLLAVSCPASSWSLEVQTGTWVLTDLGLLAAGIWLLLARKGSARGPAALVLALELTRTTGRLLPELAGSYPWSFDVISGGFVPRLGLALAFFGFVLWYPRSKISGESRCQTCGYNLTGNVSGRCPECGRPIDGVEPMPPGGSTT